MIWIYHRPGISGEHGDVDSGLWIILLEAGSALALLLGLVWWTVPKKPRDTGQARSTSDSPPPS
jgi:hypothetical protein